MPRQTRLELPGTPLHITQRGVNRCAIFLDEQDRRHYYELLRDAVHEHGIKVHAYVLMGNHVHLLLTSPERHALSRTMRNVGQCYLQAFNHRHRRSDTLWQGRFKSCLIDSERYLLTVYRYIELNPVHAAMVERPEQHRWSSVHANLNQQPDDLVTPHPIYAGTGRGSACPRGGLSHMAPPGRQRQRPAPDPATPAAGTRARRCQIPGNDRKSPWPARHGSSTRSVATIR